MSTIGAERPALAEGDRPAGVADAERLASVIREASPAKPPKHTATKRKPGRPPSRPTPRTPAAVEEDELNGELISPAEHAVARKELLKIAEGIAAFRGKRLLPDEPGTPEDQLVTAYTLSAEEAAVAADAWALTRRKFLPAAADRPELRLLALLLPWLFGVVRAELAYYLHKRASRAPAAAAPGAERGDFRPQGERKDKPIEEYVTAPFSLPGH